MQYPSQVEFADVADFETTPEASSAKKSDKQIDTLTHSQKA